MDDVDLIALLGEELGRLLTRILGESNEHDVLVVLHLEADPGHGHAMSTWACRLDHDLDAPAGSAHALARRLSHCNPRPLPRHSDDGGRVEVLHVEFRGGHRTLHR